jgi:hypothetical protein
MTFRTASLLLLAAGLASLAGCMSDEFARNEGVTLRAGNAAAANTVLQMVDPWPAGVENTDLKVPAHRRTESFRDPGAVSAGYGG